MIYMKSCPKCKGDISLGKDSYGYYAACLQCGWSKDLNKNQIKVAKVDQFRTQLDIAA
jgi:DNA-directed RNA polymerase subunit M/transcription elongation factor TFIIS